MKKVAFGRITSLPVLGLILNLVVLAVLAKLFLPQILLNASSQAFIIPTKPAVIVPAPGVEVIAGKPVSIFFPSINWSVDVSDGFYDSQKQSWTLSVDKAHYAAITPLANNYGGNTFIYGHNNPKVFSKIINIAPGSEAIVRTDNGHTFYYILRAVSDVNPYDTTLFAYTGKPILTVQTCSGSWFQDRRLFSFEYIKVASVL